MARTNFVFILIDDLGWRDLSCYGSTFYETPHLDRLGAKGMRFTEAYTARSVCSPTGCQAGLTAPIRSSSGLLSSTTCRSKKLPW